MNRLALQAYTGQYLTEQSHGLGQSWWGEGRATHSQPDFKMPIFRFPYPETDIEPTETEQSSRKSAHDLLIESLGGKCQVCGSLKDLEAHHIIPLEKGGPDAANNLMVLCRVCHVKTF